MEEKLILLPIDTFLIFFRKRKHRITILFDDFDSPKNPNLCIFPHFDLNNTLNAHCIHYLTQLKKAGCDIILVSTSNHLTNDAVIEAEKHCRAVICRSNIGRDIYSYKVGIEYALDKIARYEKLILANDSVIGPFFDIKYLINFGDAKKIDFWGATDSVQITYHLQSYFFVFTRNLACSTFFRAYWKTVKLFNNKRVLISSYELGLTRAFLQEGYTCAAYCSYLLAEKWQRLNSTHFAWDSLIINANFPFLKKELLFKNPKKIKRINFQEVVDRYADYKIKVFDNTAKLY